MVRAICRRLAPEDGVWSVLAASAVAAVLLATLALSLDLAAAGSARVAGQAALDAALEQSAHEIVPDSIASTTPSVAAPVAAALFQKALGGLLPPPEQARVTSGPTVQGNDISAQIELTVPMPAMLGTITMPLQGEVAVGWLPH